MSDSFLSMRIKESSHKKGESSLGALIRPHTECSNVNRVETPNAPKKNDHV